MAAKPANMPSAADRDQTVSTSITALTEAQQTRNAIYYGLLIAVGYLAAPIAYIDLIHASMFDTMGASKTVANLPTATAAVFGLVPLFAAWLIPSTRYIKFTISMGY